MTYFENIQVINTFFGGATTQLKFGLNLRKKWQEIISI